MSPCLQRRYGGGRMQQLAHDCSHILDQLIHPYALLALKKLRSLSEGKKFGNCCRFTTNIKFTNHQGSGLADHWRQVVKDPATQADMEPSPQTSGSNPALSARFIYMLALFDGFTEIQENELPEKLIALVIREDGFDERFPAIAAKRAAAAKT